MSSGKLDVWRLVNEGFDEKLPRHTAILMKEDFSISFAYPSEFSSIGWLLDNREETTLKQWSINPSLSEGNSFFKDAPYWNNLPLT